LALRGPSVRVFDYIGENGSLDSTLNVWKPRSRPQTVTREDVDGVIVVYREETTNMALSSLACLTNQGVVVANYVHVRLNDTITTDNAATTIAILALHYFQEDDSWNVSSVVATSTIPWTALAASEDGTVVAARNENGNVQAWQQPLPTATVEQLEDTALWVPLGLPLPGTSNSSVQADNLALSANGTILAIGDTTLSTVDVFQYQDETWMWLGQTIAGGPFFGHAVAISAEGNIVAVGAAEADTKGSFVQGQVQIYQLISDLWTLRGNSLDGDLVGANFGYSIALSGNGLVLAVGASGNDQTVGGYLQTFYNDTVLDKWLEDPYNYNADVSAGEVALSANGQILAFWDATSATTIAVQHFSACHDHDYTVHTSYPSRDGEGATTNPSRLATTTPPLPRFQPPESTNETAGISATTPPRDPTPSLEPNDAISKTLVGLVLKFGAVGSVRESEVELFQDLTANFFEAYYRN
jgi:hypothetical protein